MTTNCENSKKLAEIGFKATSDFYYSKTGTLHYIDDCEGIPIDFYSFHFETIWDSLPKKIMNYELSLLTYHKNAVIGYCDISGNYEEGISCLDNFSVKQFWAEEGSYDFKMQSLADTAAKLLIKLVEKGIINFNK